MSSERPEFQPIDTPARRTWPWAVVGAALVIALIWFARPRSAPAEAQPQVRTAAQLASVAPNLDSKVPPAPNAARPAASPAAAPAKAPEGPNVLGAAVDTAKKLATVARSELDREMARTKSAQAQVASYRKQIDDLQKQLGAARAQIAAIQNAQKPPPPTDQEQILQTLAPVLRSGGDGRP
jgi:type IV secretory pathway VirB10-like protein